MQYSHAANSTVATNSTKIGQNCIEANTSKHWTSLLKTVNNHAIISGCSHPELYNCSFGCPSYVQSLNKMTTLS